MAIRFLMTWFILSVIVGVFTYVFDRNEKKKIIKVIKIAIISAILGGVILFMMFFVNNISGV